MKVLLAYSDLPVMSIRGSMDTTLGMGCLRVHASRDRALASRVDWVNRVYPDEAGAADVAADILREGPDVAAFGCYIWNRDKTREVCALLKRRRPGMRLVVGGPEVPREEAAVREFFSGWEGLDAAVWGEGEETFTALLKAFAAGKDPAGIPGLACRRGRGVAVSPARPPFRGLDKLPSPFLAGGIGVPEDVSGGHVFLETSRGCPFQCAFCNYHAGRRSLTYFPLSRLRQELRLLKRKRYRGELYFTDPNLNIDLRRLRQTFEILREECRGWERICVMLELMAERLDDACIEVLGGVPFSIVALGIQSTRPETIRNLNRRTDLDKARGNIAKMLRHPGIQIVIELILGLPGDDYESFKATLDWCFAHERLPRVRVFDFQLLPNMPLTARREDFGIVVDSGTPRLRDVIVQTDSFSRPDLARASRLAAVCHMVQGAVDRFKGLRDAEVSAGGGAPEAVAGGSGGPGAAVPGAALPSSARGGGGRKGSRSGRPVSLRDAPESLWELYEGLLLSGPRPSTVLERLARFLVSEGLLPDRRFFTWEMWDLYQDRDPRAVLDALTRFQKRS